MKPIGVERASVWTAAARLPVLWLGGVDVASAGALVGVPSDRLPAGLAAIRAMSAAGDVAQATRALLDASAVLIQAIRPSD